MWTPALGRKKYLKWKVKMKVFISWSGELSHKVAMVMKDWLPSILQSVEPYVSSEDIDKGVRWSTDIAKELDNSKFGILCVTKENIEAPWLNFEAGALGKSFDKGKVCPFLFEIERSEVKGPILQFQSTIYEKDDVLKLIKSINSSNQDNPLDESLIDKSFDLWWPKFQEEMSKIEIKEPGKAKKTLNKTEAMLEEILELSRINQRILNSPESLLPPKYFEMLNRQNGMRQSYEVLDHPMFRRLIRTYHELYNYCNQELINNPIYESDDVTPIIKMLENLGEYIGYFESKVFPRRAIRLRPQIMEDDNV